MDDAIDFDPALAGFWPVGGRQDYGGTWRSAEDGRGWGRDPTARETSAALEIKSERPALSPVEEMQALINAMTGELRAQFCLFQTIREQAEARIGGEEAEAKAAKVDAKAAVDALALISRTMEKIDGLQRSLADALARQAEEAFDDEDYQTLLADIERRIADRAEERARQILARLDGPENGTGPPGCGL
jgi:hypothetical protein